MLIFCSFLSFYFIFRSRLSLDLSSEPVNMIGSQIHNHNNSYLSPSNKINIVFASPQKKSSSSSHIFSQNTKHHSNTSDNRSCNQINNNSVVVVSPKKANTSSKPQIITGGQQSHNNNLVPSTTRYSDFKTYSPSFEMDDNVEDSVVLPGFEANNNVNSHNQLHHHHHHHSQHPLPHTNSSSGSPNKTNNNNINRITLNASHQSPTNSIVISDGTSASGGVSASVQANVTTTLLNVTTPTVNGIGPTANSDLPLMRVSSLPAMPPPPPLPLTGKIY